LPGNPANETSDEFVDALSMSGVMPKRPMLEVGNGTL
jgi:hypothetical protein